MILDIFSKNDNSMIEIPPIINNEFLFKKYNTIYVDAPEEARRKRYNTNNKNDIDIFDQLNSFQNDYEIIKKSCNIIIKNTNSPCSLNKYFNEGIIKTCALTKNPAFSSLSFTQRSILEPSFAAVLMAAIPLDRISSFCFADIFF